MCGQREDVFGLFLIFLFYLFFYTSESTGSWIALINKIIAWQRVAVRLQVQIQL